MAHAAAAIAICLSETIAHSPDCRQIVRQAWLFDQRSLMTAEPQGKTCPNFRFQTSPVARMGCGKRFKPSAIDRPKPCSRERSCRSPGRGRLCRLPSVKAREETKEIAIRVGDDELPIARFCVALSVPALLKRDIDGGAALKACA